MAMTRTQRGFTLLENLVTISIMTVGIAGFVSAFTFNIRTATTIRNDSQALYIAGSFIEELRLRPFADLENLDVGALVNEFNTDFNGALGGEQYYQLSATVERVDVDAVLGKFYYQVTVRITWEGALEEQEAAGLDGRTASDGFAEAFIFEASISEDTSLDPYGDDLTGGT